MTILPPAAAETQLLEAAQRAGRQGPAHNLGRVALVLHLAAMLPPAPRPHHRRIARAILQDAAQRHGGQLFVLRNGDFALLCRETGLQDSGRREAGARAATWQEAPGRPRDRLGATIARPDAPPPAGHGSSMLAEALFRLLRVDVADPARLVSVWRLERDHHLLLAYAVARAEQRWADPVPSDEEPVNSVGVVDEIGALVGNSRIHDLMQRQTAVVLLTPDAREVRRSGTSEAAAATAVPGSALRPLYREVTFSIAALEARLPAGGQASADPFLFRYLAGQLDRRMLDLIRDEWGRGGPLDLAIAACGAPPLHLNLTLEAILSPSFTAFAATCREAGATAGVEISLIEACADITAFAAARDAVIRAGMALVLDGVSHLALLLASPWMLEPDLLKLDWSPRLGDLSAADQGDMASAIAATGAHRIVLHRAETEAALRWGLARGIRRFQGRHVDAMLAASRIVGCPLAAGCTLRQCIERACATGPTARAGCGNTALLDAAIPPRVSARAGAPTSA